jgi:hypothetical protein
MDTGFSPWQRLKSKRISYLTIPLLLMATVTEFVILATGWKYQQVVCLPQGMGVTFLGIGPIGATILACELLKLPLAIWTASRIGWQKWFMILCGLPLICVLTFQLVKDMAVYEMGVAMTPASQMLEKASAEDIKIAHLTAELKGIEEKRAERDRKLAELTAKQAKARADLEESIKRNDAARQDAISLTDYQKKELSDVEARQANIISQFNADTATLTKEINDLRARREVEVGRSTKWNAEEARIENAYKTKMTEYTNKKAAYDKAKDEYDHANFVHRQLLKEPVSPGVPPEREVNTILKPISLDELDAQLKTKEAELLAVNNKRRDRVAQVDADARRVREQFDTRSGSKREEADKKREELSGQLAALATEEKTQREQLDKDFDSVVQKVDGIQTEINACRKKAEEYYEAREAAIRKTQVHRIATTVEIVRGLIKGERPMSIKATAKERGDILTDQISMVRIWVYPVLAFIVAFLPTLMVEIGFSTIFEPPSLRPAHRLGFFGRRMHWVYTRAGRIKMLRYERTAKQATSQLASRDQAIAQKDRELTELREAVNGATARQQEEMNRKEADYAAQAKRKETEYVEHAKRKEVEYVEQAKRKEADWTAKVSGMADSLNRAIVEKDSLRDSQASEIERQVQLRQGAWSDRLAQSRRELDELRASNEAQRTAMMEAHHTKLMEVTENYRNQLVQARRQIEEGELGRVEKSTKMAHDLKEAQEAREQAESKLKHQTELLAAETSQTKEDAARDLEKAARQAKNDLERQQIESEKTLRQKLQQQEASFAAKLKQREEELAIRAAARETELKNQFAATLRLGEEEWERRAESHANSTEVRLRHEAQQNEELFQSKSRQRDQQWQLKLDAARAETQTAADEVLRRTQLEAGAARRELETQLRREIKENEENFQARWKQREYEVTAQLNSQADARLNDARAQWEKDADKKTRAALEPYLAQLERAEKERDEAREAAVQSAQHVLDVEKQLAEASSFLAGRRNGKRPAGAATTQPGRTDWDSE